MAEGSLVGDVRLILWRLEAPSTAAEFDVVGWRPDEMISRVRRKKEGRESGSLILSFFFSVVKFVVFCCVLLCFVVFCCVLFLFFLYSRSRTDVSAQIHIGE